MQYESAIEGLTSNPTTTHFAIHQLTWAIRSICTVTFVVLAGASLLFAATSASTSGATLPFMGHGVLIVKSGSMSPSLNAGDAIVVRNVDRRAVQGLERGSIVTFESPDNDGLLITHRIVDRLTRGHSGPTFVTQGDANATVDTTLLSSDRLVGTVVVRIPRGGYALHAIQQPQILALTIASLLLAQAAVAATGATIPQNRKRKS